MSVAHGEDDQADLVEISRAEIGDVPAELALTDLVALLALVRPVRRAPIGERRQADLMLVQQRDRVVDQRVDFGPLHRSPSAARRPTFRLR